jgi:uncharacterized protein with von Willebrand factor type A (vWA) domain
MTAARFTTGDRLVHRVVDFARGLRTSGLPVDSERIAVALNAVAAVGLQRREDLHAALRCTLVGAREHQALFDSAFEAFWRSTAAPEPTPTASARPDAGTPPGPSGGAATLGVGALATGGEDPQPASEAAEGSDAERLGGRDFEDMTPQEFALACRLVRELPPPVDPITARRWRAARTGRIDLRGTLRTMARDPGLLRPRRRARIERPPPLVVLCDVSGSMDRYARVMLHYAHALARSQPRVAVFTFGTRLTEVGRALRGPDAERAIEAVARAVPDWGGGTRIGAALEEFNRAWARRVLTGRAAVLLVTDGLDHGDGRALGEAAQRLARFAYRVIWLNPLLRYDGFEPRAAGVRALLPHVDRHLPVHSLESLEGLTRVARGV